MHPKSPFLSNAGVASFTFLTHDSLQIMSLLISEDPAGWAGCTLGQKNREMVKRESAKPGGKYSPVSAAAQGEGLQVCDKGWKETKRDGWAPKGGDLDANISCSSFARSSMQMLQREG